MRAHTEEWWECEHAQRIMEEITTGGIVSALRKKEGDLDMYTGKWSASD